METLGAAGCRSRLIGGLAREAPSHRRERIHCSVDGGFCFDAGCDEIWAEGGVYAQRAEEEGFFGGGPVARSRQ